MGLEWRVAFDGGTLWASEPEGEPLAGGVWLAGDEPIRAYRSLENMWGVRSDQQLRAPDTYSFIRLFGRSILQIRRRTVYFDWLVDILGSLRYLPPPISQHPAPPLRQLQVYQGTFRVMFRKATALSIRIFNLPFELPIPPWRWLPWNFGVRHTVTLVRGRVSLAYEPNIAARIEGSAEGTFDPPGLQNAELPVQATFESAVPARPWEERSQFPIRNFVLKGRWTRDVGEL